MANGQIRGVNPYTGVTPFATDGFESGNFASPTGSLVWSNPTGSYSQSVATTPQVHAGTYAAQITYSATNGQIAFDLGQELSEVWIEYYLYVPSNYSTANMVTLNTEAKFFYLWRRSYGDVFAQAWWVAMDFYPLLTGVYGSARPISTRWDAINSYDMGNANCTGSNQGGSLIGPGSALTIGAWNQIRWHFKAASSAASSDGVYYLAINGTPFSNVKNGKFFSYPGAPQTVGTGSTATSIVIPVNGLTNGYVANDFVGMQVTWNGQSKIVTSDNGGGTNLTLNFGSSWSGTPVNGDACTLTWLDSKLRRGYIMGYFNPTYTQQTVFSVDDFKAYSSNPGWG